MNAVAIRRRLTGVWHMVPAAGFLLSYFVARGVIEQTEWPLAVRIAAAVVPVPLFILWIISWMRAIRQSDELERRIQLEALAFAFPCAMVVIMALGLIELVVPLPKEDLSYRHVWALLPLFYFAGIALSRRRYL